MGVFFTFFIFSFALIKFYQLDVVILLDLINLLDAVIVLQAFKVLYTDIVLNFYSIIEIIKQNSYVLAFPSHLNQLFFNFQNSIENQLQKRILQQMSASYYNLQSQNAISTLLENIQYETQTINQIKKTKPINTNQSQLQFFHYYALLYLRYLQAYTQLQDSYDQTIHPQKRPLIKQILDITIVRMCQVKQNIIKYSTRSNISQSVQVNIDQILHSMELTPKALDIQIPRFFHDRKTTRDAIIQKIVKQHRIGEEIQEIHDKVTLDTNSQTAVRIIQKLQRGRQGILRCLEFRRIKNKLQKDRSSEIENQEQQRAITVQKYWRAFLDRKKVNQRRKQELKLLEIEKQPIKTRLLEAVARKRQQNKILQKTKEELFQSDQNKLINQIRKVEAPTIKAEMLDQRRSWIRKFIETYQFTNLPTNAQDFYKKRGQIQKQEKNLKEKIKDIKGRKQKKNDADKVQTASQQIRPTQQFIKLEQQIKQYNLTWGARDQFQVFQQNYDREMAKQKLRPGVEDQMQKLIDGIINLELDNMRIKYGIKKRKQKKKKIKTYKDTKIKIPQGLGKQQPSQILEELFQKNIAKKLQDAKLKDFKGQHNTVNYIIQRKSQQQIDPSLSQVKNLVAQYIGLPLSSRYAKEKLEKSSWFLFYGPTGTGKTMLLRALHKETNAIVFDLTPEVVKEKYHEKAQLVKLIWSVIICAKKFQPSIIMIDDFQSIFYGGKYKKNTVTSFGPKIKKIITDMKKNKLWCKNDQIAVIASTNKPYDANIKEVKKLFDKKIYFPYPNYSTRKLLIKHFVETKIGLQINHFPYHTIAHVTEGFTAGSFKATIDKILTPKRILRLKDQPLTVNEFINPLSHSICVFAQQYEKIKMFTDQLFGLKHRKDAKKEHRKTDGKEKKVTAKK